MASKSLEWWKDPTFAPFFGGNGGKQQQAQQRNVTPIGAANGMHGYTGGGPDNTVQPDRRVPAVGGGQYDGHEGEFVLDANATQAIGPDVLAQVMKAAKAGKLDLNKLREAVGMTPKPGFQGGGMAPAIGTPPTKRQQSNQGTANAIPAPNAVRTPTTPSPITPITPDPVEPGKIDLNQGVNAPILNQNIVSPMGSSIVPDPNLVLDKTNVNPASLLTGKEVKPIKNVQQAVPPLKPAAEVQKSAIPMKPVADVQKSAILKPVGEVQQSAIPVKPAKEVEQKAFVPFADKNAAIKAINDLPVEIQDKINTIPQQEIIDYLMGIMKGDNPYFKMLQDLLAQRIGGAGAAATAAMKQEAAMSGWGKEQLASLGIGRQRDVEAMASGQMGELAAQQAGMGMEAASKLWGMQQDLQAQENWEKQFGMSKEQWEKEFGWQKESWEKSFDYTKLTDAQKNEQWQKMFDNDNAKWQKTWDESIKDKDFNKQTDMLNALLSSGGEANLKKASEMMKQMYGQDIDFDNLLDAEKQSDFNTAWNNMGGLIASNMDWEDALMTMKKDGTFEKLGMSEEDLKRVYEKQKLQNDPVYKMMNQVDEWVKQGIMTEEQGQQYKDLFQWSLTHPDGIEIKDGWVAKDEAGNEVGFFTSKQELDDFLKKNPTYKDGGFMKGHISKKDIGGDSGTGTGTGTGTGPSIPQGGKTGDIFIKDGKVYIINDKGVPEETFDADIPEGIKNGDAFLIGEGPEAQMYILGSNGLAKKLDDSIYNDPWGKTAQTAIEFGETSPYGKKLLDLRIDDIISGKKEFSKLDNATCQAMKTSNKIAQYTIDSLKTGGYVTDNRYALDALEKIAPGKIVTVGGRVLKFVGTQRKKRGGTDGTYYKFVDADGKAVRLYCKGQNTEDIYWA